jgi:hypothetical protein
MPVIISADDSESESDSKKQDVYGVIIRDKLREEIAGRGGPGTAAPRQIGNRQ